MNLNNRDLIEIESFGGLITKSDFRDVSSNYSPDCQNVIFSPGSTGSRPGTDTALNINVTGTVIHADYFHYADVRYYLVLVNNGGTKTIYYYTWNPIAETVIAGPTAVKVVNTNAVHFTVAVYGTFVYIFPNDGAYGTDGPWVWTLSVLPTIRVDLATILPEPNIGVKASQTLSGTGTPANNDTVTITVPSFAHNGSTAFVFTFKTALTPTAGEVLIGGSLAAALTNLKAAINRDPDVEDSTYVPITNDPWVVIEATTLTATTLKVEARQTGSTQNGILTTKASANLSWGAGSLASGSGFDAGDGPEGEMTGGFKGIRVLFKTRTGYISAPSDYRVHLQKQNGSMELTGIPLYTGDGNHAAAECTGRIIIMTESFGDDEVLAEMLDRLNWRSARDASYYEALVIDDNTTTTATIDISDEQLVQELNWDHAFTFTSPLPNFAVGRIYHERMVACGNSAKGTRQYISEPFFPQNFRDDVGFKDLRQDDGLRIVTMFQIRDYLYAVKTLGLFSMIDFGGTPDTWSTGVVAEDLGTTSIDGVTEKSDEDFVMILDYRGLYYFNGSPPRKISKGIQPEFDRLNIAVGDENHVYIDTVNRRIHALVCTGVATSPNEDFVVDYDEGLSEQDLAWTIWKTAGLAWNCFIVDGPFFYALGGGVLMRQFDPDNITDNGTAIDWYYETGVIENRDAGLSLFDYLNFHVTGAGTLNLTVKGPDGATIITPTGLTLSSTPGKDLHRGMNVVKERIFVRFGQNSTTGWAEVNKLSITAVPMGVRV